jgi:hypothetical protein
MENGRGCVGQVQSALSLCAGMNNEITGEPQEKVMQITADRLRASATTG